MYKSTAAGLRRATGVHRIAPVAEATERDLLPHPEKMTLRQIEEERAQLIRENTRVEQEIAIARREGNNSNLKFLGAKKAALCLRIAEMKSARHQVRVDTEHESFRAAVRELVSDDLLQAIYARHHEIRDRMHRTGE